MNNQTGSVSDSNMFFSPFSVFTAMGMVSEGASGNTLTEMQGALGLSNNSQDNRVGFESLLYDLMSHGSDYQLSVADSAWIEKDFPVEQSFTKTLSSYYYATVQQANFSGNTEGERANINSWVAEKTNNKILNLMPPGSVDAGTRLVLADAIYFKGLWAQQFDASATVPGPFFVSPSVNVTVQMMHLTGKNMSYYSNYSIQALKLDYKGNGVSMIILLPTRNSSLSQLESGLSASEFEGIRSELANGGRGEVSISLPRFNMTRTQDMSSTLEAIGMKSAFDTSANFSGISANQGLHISDVLHKAFIDVNEQGTEAAAATAVGISGTAYEMPLEFNANHPFVFFIVDNHSGAILFMGTMANPTISGS